MKTIFCFLIIVLFISCKKDKGELPVYGTLHNLKGFDGCGWVINLDKKEKSGCSALEPTNLSDFNLILLEGARLEFLYTDLKSASVCMVGKVVSIRSIKVLK